MPYKLKILLQYLVPQHALSQLAGWLANCRWRRWKNWLIQDFIQRYAVDLHIAQLETIEDYPNFNSFFTRQLKPELRPIVQGSHEIASPVDGCISQIGFMHKESLLQAKGSYYNLNALLGGDTPYNKIFSNGAYITLYLAPKDYHRVHMPLSGQLRETIYIPGKLFSVNPQTTLGVPNLFSRNERLICFFDTDFGSMAVILIGAMLVSGIETVWPLQTNFKKTTKNTYSNLINLNRGSELGHFKMGSTVIVLFAEKSMEWSKHLKENSVVKMGELLAVACS